MGLQKVAFNFLVERGGKNAKSLLCSKTQKAVDINRLQYLPQDIPIKSKTINFTSHSGNSIQGDQSFFARTSQVTDKVQQSRIKEHGLTEIMSDSVHTPTEIGQTPVYSPLKPELPEHYIKVEGSIIPCERDVYGNIVTEYKIYPSKEDKYLQYVQFFDKEGYKVGARIPVRCTSKTREELIQALNRPKVQTTVPVEPQETWLEKTIKGLQEPKGTVNKLVRLDNEGNTIVRFLDQGERFIRKVKINPDGRVLEYSNFRTLVSDKGIKNAHLSGRMTDGTIYTTTGPRGWGTVPIDEVLFNKSVSNFMLIREESRYILSPNGEVARTIQTRKFTPHESGKIGVCGSTTVDSRTMGDGRFVEDVVITKGDKRFSGSYWFDQRSGDVLTMDGWSKGLTKKEIEFIKSDPFLASRYYNDSLDFVRTEKFNSYRMQQLRNKTIPLKFDAPNGTENGYYCHGRRNWLGKLYGRRINLTPSYVAREAKHYLVDLLHHESEHGRHYQLIEDLDAGLLNGEEKIQAEIFKDNYAHYVKDGFEYFNQPVEVAARKKGEAAAKQFKENGEIIDKIFFG